MQENITTIPFLIIQISETIKKFEVLKINKRRYRF